MPYIVLFHDNPDAPAHIRATHMADHLDFLSTQHPRIRAAGPLNHPDAPPHAGLWIVDVDSPDAVEALIRADPFWLTGLRQTHDILHWKQVYPPSQTIQ